MRARGSNRGALVAHRRGVLHHDRKPGSRMLGPHGETLLAGWGLAEPLGQREEAPAGLAEGPVWPTSQGSILRKVRNGDFRPPREINRRMPLQLMSIEACYA